MSELTSPIRVLVVDDSAFARKVVREVIAKDPAFEVVDIARDGLEALEKIAALSPDVVTLDLVMPGLDGLGVLRALPETGAPRVVVVSFSDADTEIGAEALQAGAVELVKKPTALATDRMYELRHPLLQALRTAAQARPLPERGPPAERIAPTPAEPTAVDLVVVGTSTGGPQALTHLASQLPRDLPVPVVIALHIPAGYTQALAKRLDGISPLGIQEAHDGMRLERGTALVAPGGMHLRIERASDGGLLARVDTRPLESTYAPSVNVLFESAAEATRGRVLGVVLTGMGDDGLVGARRIRELGGRIIHEDERSCVIYGMPRVVAEAGLSLGSAPIDEMGELIVKQLGP